jgi:hypothetical protein
LLPHSGHHWLTPHGTADCKAAPLIRRPIIIQSTIFRKFYLSESAEGIAEAFNMWSEDRFPATAPTLADFLNWMPSTETQDAGDAEEIQESAESAFAATLQGI